MAEEEGAVSRLHAELLRYDALSPDVPAAWRRLAVGARPRAGDRVLVIADGRAQVIVFGAGSTSGDRTWVVGVLRRD